MINIIILSLLLVLLIIHKPLSNLNGNYKKMLTFFMKEASRAPGYLGCPGATRGRMDSKNKRTNKQNMINIFL